MMIIGIECCISNEENAVSRDIPRLWQQFYAQDIQSKIPNVTSNEIVALYCDYEGDYTRPYSCVIGCTVHSLEQILMGMVGKVIPASHFVHFRATGEFPKSLIDTWDSNLKRTYLSDYEIYGQRFAANPRVRDSGVAKEGIKSIQLQNPSLLPNLLISLPIF